ncbi:hypothetical protein PAXRUDRAFT_178145 [Paxillus rubicundulus Ve08.2h10]|uniref:Unplaced genomic scaffold scaffold_4816, whole genome shotgun sequence n=1 Tax=Paxillus rubicundulus Ve08.2h10 TaxID=930991 RepID=A0A0D0D8U2_9AGAM|nr:hypothetical protein PAXRUDRAFT_178145 [Paxillus rubicundulus Ve08.2h10]
MKTSLTRLIVTISLSAYTLVGVHAKCPLCPASVGGVALTKRCTNSGTYRQSRYQKLPVGPGGWIRHCEYDVRIR